MSIYKITYLSDHHRVSGYLGFPQAIVLDTMKLQSLLAHVCCSTEALPLSHQVTCDYPPTVPASITLPRYPAILYCRGGIGRVGQVRIDWIRSLTAQNFVVFAPCYRGSEGGEGRDEFGGADVKDVTVGFDIIHNLPLVDPTRISVLGFSRGSINATLATIARPQVYTLVLWGGVSNLAATYEQRIDLRRMLRRVIGGTPSNKSEAYRARSPLYQIHDVTSHVLVVHGSRDTQVHVSHADALSNVLWQMKKPFTYQRYFGLAHHLPQPIHDAVIDRICSALR